MSFFRRIPAFIRVPYEYVVLFASIALFGGGGLVFTVVGAVLYIVLPRRTGIVVGRRTMHFLFRFFVFWLRASGIVKLDLRRLDALRDARNVIIAPNHISLLDAVFVIARLPNVVCIMKAKIWDNIFLGGGARLAGYIRNDSPANMVRLAAEELRNGAQLLVFPEGTRTVSPPVNRFKGGFALIAKKAGARVRTVFIRANSGFLGKGWPLWRKPEFPLRYALAPGESFEVGENENTKEFVARLEAYYAETLEGSCPQLPKHPGELS